MVPIAWVRQWQAWSSSTSKEDGAKLKPTAPVPTEAFVAAGATADTIGVLPLLRPGLVEGLNYEWWPAPAWDLLAEWYAAPRPVPRPCVNVN